MKRHAARRFRGSNRLNHWRKSVRQINFRHWPRNSHFCSDDKKLPNQRAKTTAELTGQARQKLSRRCFRGVCPATSNRCPRRNLSKILRRVHSACKDCMTKAAIFKAKSYANRAPEKDDFHCRKMRDLFDENICQCKEKRRKKHRAHAFTKNWVYFAWTIKSRIHLLIWSYH